jgi:ubiquinone/menaquinone biosynthesis C-methylase UbiE
MISRLLPTQILLIPVHALEALSVRYRFAEALYHWMAPVYQSIRPLFYFGEDRFEAAVRAGHRVLEMGSGTGYLSRRLARKAVSKGGGAHYVVGDMAKLPFKNESFDRCVSLGALHCLDPVEFFQGVSEVLRPRGEASVLSEVWIMPRLLSQLKQEPIREAIRKSGMRVTGEMQVKRLYRLFWASRS